MEIHNKIAARRTSGPRHAQGRDTTLLRLHLKATRDSLNPRRLMTGKQEIGNQIVRVKFLNLT